MSAPEAERGYAVLARELREAGLLTLFGVMGEANLDLIACLSDRHGAHYVPARHEAGAVAMADGFSRASGAVGFATVTCGPGLTNALTPLVTAVRSHAEVLLVTGQLPLEATGRSQTIDHQALIAPTGAGIVHVAEAADLPGAAASALRRVRQERRPYVLNVLMPVLDGLCPAPARAAAVAYQSEPPPPPVTREEITRAAALLASASRPVLLAGRGAVEAGAGEALRALGRRLGARCVTTLLAHGLLSGEDGDLGIAGGLASTEGQRALEDADVIAAFGASLNGWTTRAGTTGREAAIIQVDRDPTSFARSTVPIAIPVQGDVGAVLAELEAELDRITARAAVPQPGPVPVEETTTANRRPGEEEPDRTGASSLDPRDLCRALDAALPRDRTVTVDAGQFFEFPTKFMSVPDPRGYLVTISFGTVGLGLATATGAAYGRPDRLSVAFVGDGGLMMSLADLDAVARCGRPMLVVVINDGAYGAEIKHLEDRGWNPDLARFTNPPFAKLAETLGIRGYAVATPDELRAALREIGTADRPTLIDARVDPTVRAEWMAVMHAARTA